MDGAESKELAQAWLDFQKNWWAYDRLDELCRRDPKAAWNVLNELVRMADSRELLEDIGVGPLEDFINNHAQIFIDELEARVDGDERLSQALGYAQLRDSTHPMAARLTALGCRVSGAGKQTDAFDDRS